MINSLEFILQVLIAVLGFSILVFFHELGHFISAIFFKIKVEKFSIGMGPAIIGFQKGDTYFQIGAIPFGGFCKFKGDEVGENFEIIKTPDSFFGAKPYKRLLVAFSGPFMNYVVAIIFFSLLSMITHTEKYEPTKIILRDDLIKSANISPAKRDGLKTGDVILQVDGKSVDSFMKLEKLIYDHKNPIDILILRNREEKNIKVTPEWNKSVLKYVIGISSYIEPVIEVEKDAKFYNIIGFKEGDEIVGIDGNYENMCLDKFTDFIFSNFGSEKKSVINVKRNNNYIELPIEFNEINHKISEKELRKDFYKNFKIPEKEVKGKNIFSAFATGFNDSNYIIKRTAFGLYALIFKPKKDVGNQFGGVLLIGHVIGSSTIEAFKEGFLNGLREFFSIISLISLALAFFNLLPIPALDGGHILFNLIEIITRKEINLKVMYIINMIFFGILMFLGVIVIVIDYLRIRSM